MDRAGGVADRATVGGLPFSDCWVLLLPFKLNQDRCHHVPKRKRKVTNSAAYDAALRQRGSLTIWFTEEAVAVWRAEPLTTAGGQAWHSSLAVLTALALRAVFRLALRQTEGLTGSITGLLGLALAVPDHRTPSRRAATRETPRPRRDGEPIHLLVDSVGRLVKEEFSALLEIGEIGAERGVEYLMHAALDAPGDEGQAGGHFHGEGGGVHSGAFLLGETGPFVRTEELALQDPFFEIDPPRSREAAGGKDSVEYLDERMKRFRPRPENRRCIDGRGLVEQPVRPYGQEQPLPRWPDVDGDAPCATHHRTFFRPEPFSGAVPSRGTVPSISQGIMDRAKLLRGGTGSVF